MTIEKTFTLSVDDRELIQKRLPSSNGKKPMRFLTWPKLMQLKMERILKGSEHGIGLLKRANDGTSGWKRRRRELEMSHSKVYMFYSHSFGIE